MPRARLQAAWAHARRAEQELAALVEEEDAYNGLPDDLPGAYIQLRREHDALRAKYEEEREAWLAFKAWWRSRVRERRAIKRAQPEPDEVPEAQGSTPSTPRKRRTEITSPVRSPIPTPRRSRERVLQHRTHVRQLLQENPALFKGNGRCTPRTVRAAVMYVYGLIQYYAAVGRPAKPEGPQSPSDDAQKSAHARRQVSSRHRHTDAPDPTPPDYWMQTRRASSRLATRLEEKTEPAVDAGQKRRAEASPTPPRGRAAPKKARAAPKKKGDTAPAEAGPSTPKERVRARPAPQAPSSESESDSDTPVRARRRARASASAAEMARSLPPLSLPARPHSLHALPDEKLAQLSAHERARRLLHVGATPEALPCRQQQFLDVLECTTDALRAGAGECAYIYGVPGTGKTATVREAIRTLEHRKARGEIPAFQFVEINGMKLASAMQAYTELWSAVHGGKRLHPRAALSRLTAHFNAGNGEHRAPIVVLMDELDLFVTSRQDVIYNLFHWPNLPGSNLVVIAVANTMDLPERTLQPKVASRLGMTRIPFMPYTDRQLLDIVRARLDIDEQGTRVGTSAATQGCEHVFRVDALMFASKRVANVSGDARRMLDVCRRAVELAEHRAAVAGCDADPISILEIREVLDKMARSGRAAHVAALSLHAKLLLSSMYACARRNEVAEVVWGDVLSHHASLCRTHSVARLGTTHDTGIQDYNEHELLRPLATLCALGIVVAVGAGAGSARAGPHARYLVVIPEEEGKHALQDARIPGL